MTNKKMATLRDWAIVKYPEICDVIDDPTPAFARYGDIGEIVLFGKAVDDPRFDAVTGEFSDGHRVLTSQLINVEGHNYETENTVYTLKEEDMSEEYRKWCNKDSLEVKGMLGSPKYKKGDEVCFHSQYDNEDKIGFIVIVDAYGSWEAPEEPSYDITIQESNGPCLYKHVAERYVFLPDDSTGC